MCSVDNGLDAVGVISPGVLGLESAGVMGNFSRIGSISEKYIPMPLALTVILLAISCKWRKSPGANRPYIKSLWMRRAEAARGTRAPSDCLTDAVIEVTIEAKEGESVGVLSSLRLSSKDFERGDNTSWSLAVNWAEIVEGNIKMDERREIAEWKAKGRMIALPI